MKLDHIQLAMPQGKEDEARSFFINILEMEEETKPEPLASRGGCWFRKDGVLVHLGVEKNFTPQKKAHPAFIADNLLNLEKKLKEKSYDVIWDDALPNCNRFYTTDPFGNRIEFLKNGDGFSQK
jgi:catechol 2,3-dioxygenase-like lactoylglutathione lyase family enzyme